MIKTFNEKELIEVNGKFVEKECAFPNLEGDQTAIMLKWENGKWTVFGWGSSLDANYVEACGWEPLIETHKSTAIAFITGLMSDIENGE